MTDDERRYRAVRCRDPRFDGLFFVAVTTTGIYCRPSCASVLPGRDRMRFYPTAAAAQLAGFRACKRCRPDASPGSPEWSRRDDLVARAMRAISDGVVDRQRVSGLASRLGYSTRQLNRTLLAEVGAGALDLARAQRAQTARILLETSALRIADIAFASGFGSVRQFNDTIQAVFAETPSALRDRALSRVGPDARAESAVGGGVISLRLAFRAPFASEQLFSFLAARAVPGVEEGDRSFYRRSLRLPHGGGVVSVSGAASGARFLVAQLLLDDLRDLGTASKRLRRQFDLDADPSAVMELLAGDPWLGKAVDAIPGLRIPGQVDGEELAIRALLGQQVSVAGARSLAGQLVARCGSAIKRPWGTVCREFPSAAELAALSPEQMPMPASRGRALLQLAEALARGEIELGPGADRERASAALLGIPGIGPWTVAYIRMRALADPDAFPAQDLGLRRALETAGLPSAPIAAERMAERWRPYRAYALQYIWSGAVTGGHARAGRRTPRRGVQSEGSFEPRRSREEVLIA